MKLSLLLPVNTVITLPTPKGESRNIIEIHTIKFERAITIERAIKKRSKDLILEMKQRRLRAIGIIWYNINYFAFLVHQYYLCLV